jgi:hypothetical protein
VRYESLTRATFKVTGITGQEALCVCPWHDDRSPGHLYVNVVGGMYICFSCGAKGHLDRLSGNLPSQTSDGIRDRLKNLRQPHKPVKTYPEGWLKQFDVPHPYWTVDRGLPDATVQQFGLGFDPFTNRLTLPLRDLHGRVLGVTYRRLDDGKPKYLHPKGFPIGRHLYGAWLLEEQRRVAIVEGQVDAIRCWAARVPALGLMGARITPDQIKVLKHLGIQKVALMLDNDLAGIKGTVAVSESLAGTGIQVVAGWYRDYWRVKDPDGLKEDRLRKMYHSAVPMTEWAGHVALP